MENTTQFAQHWMEANRLLMLGIASPSPSMFRAAEHCAALAFKYAWKPGSRSTVSTEQSLARTLIDEIRRAAREHCAPIDAPKEPE